MPDFGQGPGAAARNASTAAENARIDAQLELAAKKAALRGLQAEAEGGGPATAPAAPPPPGMSRTTIVMEKDGKTTVLENPTAEQLRQVGISGTAMPPMEGWAIVAITGMGVGTVLIVASLIFKYLTSRQRGHAGAGTAYDDARMSRLENAIETVAVEVERVSESQRYVSRILSEGAAQPVVGVAQGERVMRNNGEG